MRWSLFTVLASSFAFMLAGVSALNAQSRANPAESFEAPAVLLAADVLSERLLHSNEHRVGAQIKLDHNLMQMELTSSFGVTEVTSLAMLEIRIREFLTLSQALARYAQRNSQLAGEIRGRLRIGHDARVKLLSPRLGSGSNLSSQLTANDTIIAARGVGRSPRVLPKQPKVGGEGPVYELHRRSVAYQLHLDPYSTNPQVQRFLATVANARSRGRFSAGSGLVLSLPKAASRGVDGGRIDTEVSSLLRHLELEELDSGLAQELTAMGVSAALTGEFLNHRHYSPRLKASIAAHLDYVGGVAGRDAVISAAMGARSEAEALSFEQLARMLALYHERVAPFQRLISGGAALPGALREDGGSCYFCPWTICTGRALQNRSSSPYAAQMGCRPVAPSTW